MNLATITVKRTLSCCADEALVVLRDVNNYRVGLTDYNTAEEAFLLIVEQADSGKEVIVRREFARSFERFCRKLVGDDLPFDFTDTFLDSCAVLVEVG